MTLHFSRLPLQKLKSSTAHNFFFPSIKYFDNHGRNKFKIFLNKKKGIKHGFIRAVKLFCFSRSSCALILFGHEIILQYRLSSKSFSISTSLENTRMFGIVSVRGSFGVVMDTLSTDTTLFCTHMLITIFFFSGIHNHSGISC